MGMADNFDWIDRLGNCFFRALVIRKQISNVEIETLSEHNKKKSKNTDDSTDKLAGCLKWMLFQIVYPQCLPNALELTVTDVQPYERLNG